MSQVKRAESTESSHTVEDYRHPPKKLKLIIRERTVYSVIDELEKAGDVNTALSLLFEVSGFYPLKSKDADALFVRLLQHFRLLPVAWLDVKLKIIEVLRTIVKSAWIPKSTGAGAQQVYAESPENLASYITDYIVEEDEPECVNALLCLLHDFQHYLSCESTSYKRMLALCRQCLQSADLWAGRATSLRLLTVALLRQRHWRRELMLQPVVANMDAASAPMLSPNPAISDDLESTLCLYTEDADGRVRAVSAECLLQVNQNGWLLPRTHYELVCRLTKDENEEVRLLGLRLIKIYASTAMYVETMVAGANENVEVRLIDHAFSTLCNAMHDLSVVVRTEAAALLGTFKNVSEKFLEQTLDKKLMSKMKFVKSSHHERKGGLQQNDLSEWATGRKFGEDAPMEKAEEDSASLIPSGACGAFVTGLEDEHMSVRNASINAVSNLAADCPVFARRALDFLADMFNDEIETVRLNAIISLQQLCRHIVLKEEQMEVILSALDDASPDSREALRDLLRVCNMADVPCLRMTIDALMNNMKRYPVDRLSIWKCMKFLGTNHSSLVIPLAPEWLDLHPFFDTNEPALEDCFYIAKLILVLNAAVKCPPIKALFLDHTWRHYRYLRSSVPHLVTNLEVVVPAMTATDGKVDKLSDSSHVLSRCRAILTSVLKFTSAAKWELTAVVLDDLRRLVSFLSADEDDEETASSEDRWRADCFLYCVESCLKTEKLLERCLDRSRWATQTLNEELKEALKKTWALEHLWNCSEIESMKQLINGLRLRIAAGLIAVTKEDGRTQAECRSYLSLYLTTLESLRKDSSNNENLSNLNRLSEDLSYDNTATKARDIIQCLLSDPLNFASIDLLSATVRRKRATIVEPLRENDVVMKFVAGLVASLHVTANLYDFDEADLANVRVRILYPDQRERFIQPRLSHFRRINATMHRLRTEVLISDSCWTEAGNVQLSLVYQTSKDETATSTNWLNLTTNPDDITRSTSNAVAVTVKVHPKPRC